MNFVFQFVNRLKHGLHIDTLNRQIRQMMPWPTDPEQLLPSPTATVLYVTGLLRGKCLTYSEMEIKQAVKKRLLQIKHIFRRKLAEKSATGCLDFSRVTDRSKTLKAIRLLTTKINRQRLRPLVKENLHLNMDDEFTKDFEEKFYDCVKGQSWTGVCDVFYPGYGRGVMATTVFHRNDIILDYHGIIVEKVTFHDYVQADPLRRKHEFIVEVQQNGKRLIDASDERCDEKHHEQGLRCLGRLCNFSKSKMNNGYANKNCNVRLTEITIKSLESDKNGRYAVLVAKQDIQPFEQILYDYKDKTAHHLFK